MIYQKKGDGKYLKIKTITSGKTTSYTKKSLSSATKYTYKIKAYDKVGSKKVYSEYSSAKSAYTKPSKVTVSSVSAVSATSIKIKWKKVSRADGYEIYQKKASGEYVDMSESNEIENLTPYLVENGDSNVPYDLYIMANGIIYANSNSRFNAYLS